MSKLSEILQAELKHDAGAIVDIEFMVQYAVLGWASKHPVLSRDRRYAVAG